MFSISASTDLADDWWFKIFWQKKNGILLPKLFRPIVKKNCSSDQEKLLKFEAEGWEFAKIWIFKGAQYSQILLGDKNATSLCSKIFLLYQGIGKGLGNLKSKVDKNIGNLNF